MLPYHTIGDCKVDQPKRFIDFRKEMRDVRILVWKKHCALIQNPEIILERSNLSRYNFRLCVICTYWFILESSYRNNEGDHVCIPRLVCLETKEISFINEKNKRSKGC